MEKSVTPEVGSWENSCIFTGNLLSTDFMEKKMTFAPNVLLIDAVYLNRVGKDMAAHFAPILGRELPEADLPLLLECLALDAGISAGENDIQVIFIYDSSVRRMDFCKPSDMEKELNDVAFRSRLGEFSVYSFQPSGMASREDLFVESLRLLGESKEARRIAVVADEKADRERVTEAVGEWKKKDGVTVLGMNPPASPCRGFRFEMLGFAVLQSLGIRADEL